MKRPRELGTIFYDMPTGKANPGKSPIITLLNCHKTVGGLIVSDVWHH